MNDGGNGNRRKGQTHVPGHHIAEMLNYNTCLQKLIIGVYVDHVEAVMNVLINYESLTSLSLLKTNIYSQIYKIIIHI